MAAMLHCKSGYLSAAALTCLASSLALRLSLCFSLLPSNLGRSRLARARTMWRIATVPQDPFKYIPLEDVRYAVREMSGKHNTQVLQN